MEEDQESFFDAREDVSSVSDCNSEVPEDPCFHFNHEIAGLDLWIKNPESVANRRNKFFESMGFSFKKTARYDDSCDAETCDNSNEEPNSQFSDLSASNSVSGDHVDRVKEVELLRNESTSSVFDEFAVSSLSNSLAETLRGSFEETDDQILLSRNDSSNNSSIPEGLSESGSSKSSNFSDFQISPMKSYEDTLRKGAKCWFKKLGVLTHVLDRHGECLDCESVGPPLKQITRVQTYKKQVKELSSMWIDQEISAHDGSILAMKFSPDGKYLASGGEDCVVRVWNIIEEEMTEKDEVPEFDSGHVYFGINEESQIEPLNTNHEKNEKNKSYFRKSSDSTCVVLPSKIFRISETPKHEFRGHFGEILDLSWSEKGYLLSSSVDETVRLWRVGSEECISTFSHNNFVTCVAFNPVDDNYFISGSIDGKVRIWDVSCCRVVDYTDIRDIVTAVCYRPDAKGVVIGSMTGNCRFYNTIDNQLQLDREISLNGKKKVPSKRITGIQFVVGDSDRVMVSSADSKIRIICGDDVICKFKASSSLRTTLSSTSASFTLDGKHIISATDDSGIHVWNYANSSKKGSKKVKTIRSYEGFISQNVSVAISWFGQGDINDVISDLDKKLPHFPQVDCFSPMKGSTTWPEDKLEEAAATATMSSRGKLKLLKNACQNLGGSSTHLWGLVIVTATWDGRIRVFQNYGLPVRI